MKRCMIVDDSKIVRKMLRSILEKQGLDVLEAEDGNAALEQVRHAPVDVMILDSAMPGIDGIECLKAIRADIAIKQPRIIFCALESDIEAIRDAGADGYVMKPFDNATIGEKIASLQLT